MHGSPFHRIFVVLGILLLAATGILAWTERENPGQTADPSEKNLAPNQASNQAPNPAAPSPRSSSLPPPPPPPVTGTLKVEIEAPIAPTSFRISSPSGIVFEKREPGLAFSLQSKFTCPPSGCDLQIHARWADYLNGPRALRVKFFFDGEEIGEPVFWGENDSLDGSWNLPPQQQKSP